MRKMLMYLLMPLLAALTGLSFLASAALAAPAVQLGQGGRMQVAVGVAPLEYFAKKIGGELIQTQVLVPAGSDAHTYEPKPSQMRALTNAAMYLSVGLEFEEAWEPRLKAANKRLNFVHLEQGLALLPMPEGHEDHHKAKGRPGQHDEPDPHLWVSPAQVRQMAAKIAEAFAKADPAQAKVYAANLAVFLKEIDALDAELRGVLAGVPAEKRNFLVFHPAWGYLARDYGLTQTAIEFEGKEPSPRRLAAIVAQARAKGTRVIFVQPQMSRRTAESIAQALGARLVVADPLAPDWAANLRAVAAGFRDALR